MTSDEEADALEKAVLGCLEEQILKYRDPENRRDILYSSEEAERAERCLSTKLQHDMNATRELMLGYLDLERDVTIPQTGEKLNLQTILIKYFPTFVTKPYFRNIFGDYLFNEVGGSKCYTDTREPIQCFELAMKMVPDDTLTDAAWENYLKLVKTVSARPSSTRPHCIHPVTGNRTPCANRFLIWGEEVLDRMDNSPTLHQTYGPGGWKKNPGTYDENTTNRVKAIEDTNRLVDQHIDETSDFLQYQTCEDRRGNLDNCLSRFIEAAPIVLFSEFMRPGTTSKYLKNSLVLEQRDDTKSCKRADSGEPISCIEKYVDVAWSAIDCARSYVKHRGTRYSYGERTLPAECGEFSLLGAIAHSTDFGDVMPTFSDLLMKQSCRVGGEKAGTTSCFDRLLDAEVAFSKDLLSDGQRYEHVPGAISAIVSIQHNKARFSDPANLCRDSQGKKITCFQKMMDVAYDLTYPAGTSRTMNTYVTRMLFDNPKGSLIGSAFKKENVSRKFIPSPYQKGDFITPVQYLFYKLPLVREAYDDSSAFFEDAYQRHIRSTVSRMLLGSSGGLKEISRPVLIGDGEYHIKDQMCEDFKSGDFDVGINDQEFERDHGRKKTKQFMELCTCPEIVDEVKTATRGFKDLAAASNELMAKYRRCYDDTILKIVPENVDDNDYRNYPGVLPGLTGVYRVNILSRDFQDRVAQWNSEEFQAIKNKIEYKLLGENLSLSLRRGYGGIIFDFRGEDSAGTWYEATPKDILDDFETGDPLVQRFKDAIPEIRVLNDTIPKPGAGDYATYYVVISQRYGDYVRASTAQRWVSCFNKFSGQWNKMCEEYHGKDYIYISYLTEGSPYMPEWNARSWIIFDDDEGYAPDYITEGSVLDRLVSVQRAYSVSSGDEQLLGDAVIDILYNRGYLSDGGDEITNQEDEEEFYIEGTSSTNVNEKVVEDSLRVYTYQEKVGVPTIPFTEKLWDLDVDPLFTGTAGY